MGSTSNKKFSFFSDGLSVTQDNGEEELKELISVADDTEKKKPKTSQIPQDPYLQLELDNELTSTEQTSEIAKYLKDIEQDMAKVIESVNQSGSIFSKIAKSWSSLSWWKKLILGGAGGALIIGALTLSIMAHLIVVSVAIGVFAAITLGVFALMENHYSSEQDNAAKLNGLFAGFGRMLKSVIFALDDVREGFQVELDGLSSENKRLTSNIDEIDDLISKSTLVGESIITLVGKTRLLTSELDELGLGESNGLGDMNALRNKLSEATDTSSKVKALLAQRDVCFETLAKQIQIFEQLNKSLKERDIEAKAQIEHLNNAIVQLTTIKITKEEGREDFIKRLEETFFNDEESMRTLKEHYTKATDELHEKAAQLEKVKLEYERQVARQASMLKKQERLTDEYEDQINRAVDVGERLVNTQQTQEVGFAFRT